MPIITIQRQFRELGRIRMGERGQKGQPVKLTTFRLTSPSQELIDAAAEVYGGEVRVWADAPGGGQFDLLTSTDVLDVIVPPGNVFSQWFELWTAGGCQRRCDGETEVLTDEPCKCPSDPEQRKADAAKGRACKPTTRLSLILPRVPDVGIWRLETHGFYAAAELPGTVAVCNLATERGAMLPAQLRLHNRERKVPGEGIRRYVVPVLELPQVTTAQLTSGGVAAGALTAGSGVHGSPPIGELPAPNKFTVPGKDVDDKEAQATTSESFEVERDGGQPRSVQGGSVSSGGLGPEASDTGAGVGDSAGAGTGGRPVPSAADKATPAQIRHLMKLARDRFAARAEEAIKEMAGVESFTELNKQTASKVIETLNKMKKGSAQAPPQETPPPASAPAPNEEDLQKVMADAFGPDVEEVQ